MGMRKYILIGVGMVSARDYDTMRETVDVHLTAPQRAVVPFDVHKYKKKLNPVDTEYRESVLKTYDGFRFRATSASWEYVDSVSEQTEVE